MSMASVAAGLALALLAGAGDRATSFEGKHEKPATNESHLCIEGLTSGPKTIGFTGATGGRVRVKWGDDMVIEGRRIVLRTRDCSRIITERSSDGRVSLEVYEGGSNDLSPEMTMSAQWIEFSLEPGDTQRVPLKKAQ
jgi:hypothetical protein